MVDGCGGRLICCGKILIDLSLVTGVRMLEERYKRWSIDHCYSGAPGAIWTIVAAGVALCAVVTWATEANHLDSDFIVVLCARSASVHV